MITYFAATVTCPADSTNAASSFSFNRPTISNFQNNNDVRFAYRFTNSDTEPPTNNQLLVENIPFTTTQHTLENLECGTNVVTLIATDQVGNTGVCQFTYYRLCKCSVMYSNN